MWWKPQKVPLPGLYVVPNRVEAFALGLWQ